MADDKEIKQNHEVDHRDINLLNTILDGYYREIADVAEDTQDPAKPITYIGNGLYQLYDGRVLQLKFEYVKPPTNK